MNVLQMPRADIQFIVQQEYLRTTMPGLENSGETDENANAAGEQCRV